MRLHVLTVASTLETIIQAGHMHMHMGGADRVSTPNARIPADLVNPQVCPSININHLTFIHDL